MTNLKQKDFIEIEFTGKIKDTGEIFDSNIQEDLQKVNLNTPAKPFSFALGQGMFLKGIDDFLIGKPTKPAKYTIDLEPEQAFGKRDPKLMQMIPTKFFKQNNINPVPGAMFNFDRRIAKVLSVSGGRVTVDFNNPLAGKQVTYNIKVLGTINDINEKTKSLIDFLFKKQIKFEIKNNKLILEVEKAIKDFVIMFKDKFRDILGLELEIKGLENNKQTEKVAEI